MYDYPIWWMIIAIVLVAAIGRYMAPHELINGKRTDTCGFAAVAGPFVMIYNGIETGDRMIEWLGLLMCAAAFADLWRRDDEKPVRLIVLSCAAVMVMPVMWAQPFFTYPDIIKTEMMLLPVAAALALLYLLHRDHRRIIGDIAFPAAIVILVILFIDAANTGLVFDAVLLGAVIIAVLSLSFLFRRKRWFVLAIAAAASEAVLMTFKLWRSQAWWIYLLAAGLILIGAGLSAEARRRHPENKSALRVKLDEWKW